MQTVYTGYDEIRGLASEVAKRNEVTLDGSDRRTTDAVCGIHSPFFSWYGTLHIPYRYAEHRARDGKSFECHISCIRGMYIVRQVQLLSSAPAPGCLPRHPNGHDHQPPVDTGERERPLTVGKDRQYAEIAQRSEQLVCKRKCSQVRFLFSAPRMHNSVRHFYPLRANLRRIYLTNRKDG